MRLFNFFFNHSKQEQDKPIRDKIKNKNHFEKLLSEEKEVIKQRNEIISKGNQNDSNSYIYYAIADSYLNSAALFFAIYFYILT